MRTPRHLALSAGVGAAILLAAPLRAQQPDLLPPTDRRVAAYVTEALAQLPEIRRGAALASAEGERVPQAGALPDPTMTVGIVNDSFEAIRVGEEETSYFEAMYEQEFPWPGKRKLRTIAATGGADMATARLQRLRLTAEADVRRAYVELVLAREKLALLARTDLAWEQGEESARTRYEVGAVPQSDLIRTQLERTRLRRQRLDLEANVRIREQQLSRLLGRDPGEPVDTPWRLADLPNPRLPRLEDALADAEIRSPELLEARIGAARGSVLLDLAKRERLPDMALAAGVMPRGGLDPMWTVEFSIGLPLWADRKQDRLVAESELRREADAHGVEAVRQVLVLRSHERQALLATALETCALFESGLIVQSDAAAESTLGQYQVGRAPFTAVLEAIQSNVADRDAHAEARAEAHRLAIARWELSLAPSRPDSSAMAFTPGQDATTSLPGAADGGANGRM